MTKFLSKWFRKFHRWIAVPTALAIPAAFIIKLLGDPQLAATWERLEKVPSILMLIMAITGAYLLLLPYIVRGQRKKKTDSAVARQSGKNGG
jgi:ABC-type enterobactin transport system permease subunit